MPLVSSTCNARIWTYCCKSITDEIIQSCASAKKSTFVPLPWKITVQKLKLYYGDINVTHLHYIFQSLPKGTFTVLLWNGYDKVNKMKNKKKTNLTFLNSREALFLKIRSSQLGMILGSIAITSKAFTARFTWKKKIKTNEVLFRGYFMLSYFFRSLGFF